MANPFASRELYEKVCRRLVGRRSEVKAILAALAAGRNVLLEGPPGTSKSTILRAIAEESGLPFYLVEGNASLTPQKLIGTFNPAKVMADGFKPEYFEEGPLVKAMREGGILYIEELNRMPEEAYNALLMAAEERELHVPRLGVIRAEDTFRLVAAINPYDEVGAGKISRALLERFVKLKLDYQSRDEEVQIVKLRTGSRREWLVQLAVDLVRETRRHPTLKMGSSIRGAIDMVLIAESLARLSGGELSYGDLERAALMGVAGKVWPADPEVEPEEVVREILKNLISKAQVRLSGKGGERRENATGEDRCKEIEELSRIAPRRAAFLVKPEDIYALAQRGIRGLDALARVLMFLPLDLRTLAKEYSLKAILKLKPIEGGPRLRGRLRRRPSWEGDDVDVEATVERALDHLSSPPEPVVLCRDRGDRALVLVVDRSSSMSGFKIVAATLAAATLAYAFPADELAVIAFNERAEVLKGFGRALDREVLARRVLNLEPIGYTNFYEALRKSLWELRRAGYCVARALMITDGEWTAGPNPLPIAAEFDELHVISVPSKWWRFAREMARRGGGRFYLLRNLDELPRALSGMLS